MRHATLLAAVLAPFAAAHGDVAKAMAERREFLLHSRSNLDHCASKIAERGLDKRAALRRAAFANKLAKRSGLKERDLEDLLEVSHHSDEDYTIDTEMSVVFSGNASCVLNPEATEGPFYVAGGFVRQDLVDDQAGVPLAVDVQVMDVETCEPVPDVYLEIWHANSTGVYGGVVSAMNGAGEADPSNVDKTFHRGLQQLDADGAAQFTTLFPGHYNGRATHIHIMVHLGAEARENGTVWNDKAAHVGQMYFDQDLVSEIEALEPYSTNEQTLTTNGEDFILAEEAADTDPFMHYVRLGEGVEDGLLAWLTVAVNTSYERTVSVAASVFEEGGQVNPDAPEPLMPSGVGFPGMPPGTPSGAPTPP